jgi:hypothetical protein
MDPPPDEGSDNDTEATDPAWGRNCVNPAMAGCQKTVPRKRPKIWLSGCNTLSAFRLTQLAIDPRHIITDLSCKINSKGETTLELDSHTDKCILGPDTSILLNCDRPVVVKGYDLALGTKTYDTYRGAIAYVNLQTREVYHLVINQAIHIPHLNNHLLFSMHVLQLLWMGTCPPN